jgi:hypothetical protein
MLPLLLYGCGTWSVTPRQEHGLKVFENRVLRNACEPKRDELTGEWRRLHKKELLALYSSPNIIRVIKIKKNEIGGTCSSYGDRRGADGVLVEKPEGKTTWNT